MTTEPKRQRFRARYILDRFEFVEDAVLEVKDGRVVAIDRGHATGESPGAQRSTAVEVDLGNVALVPGLVNAHSHAFQRAIRGRTEYALASRPEEDFWTWRQAMYGAALTYSPEEFERVSRLAFQEMALSGITTVGEFHYVHHQPDGTPYANPNELAGRVISAAREVGIRISLLLVAYNRAGHGKPADPMQRRFIEADVETYLGRFEDLRAAYKDTPGVSFGLAPHSIRAVPGPWLEALGEHARAHDLPLHIHACEQRAELAESMAEYAMSPIEVFDARGILDDRLTLVHATHLSATDLDLLGAHRPTICACPTTERNLGDGFLPALELAGRRVPICLGSDSHTTIDLFEEMRLVEYHERLRHERRNVLSRELRAHGYVAPDAEELPVANMLWPMATLHGARSLGLPIGTLEPGSHADFATIDLDHITLLGTTPQTLLTDIAMSMPAGAVRDVFVGGEAIVRVGIAASCDQER